MSSQALAEDAVTLPSSRAASAEQSNSGEADHVAPITVIDESLHNNIDALSKLSISGANAKHIADDMSFRDATAEIRAVNEPLYLAMLKHHKVVQKVRSDEIDWMRTITNYHLKLERFPDHATKKGLTQDETDRQMDKHSARLLEYDVQLTAWFAHREEENACMQRCYNRAVEENVRRLQESARRAEHDRRGRSRWFKDHARWELDRARQIKEQCRWELEYKFWVRTYDRFSQERSRNLKEYKGLFMRQAQFSRIVGNYQIFRFFEEVERLNGMAEKEMDA